MLSRMMLVAAAAGCGAVAVPAQLSAAQRVLATGWASGPVPVAQVAATDNSPGSGIELRVLASPNQKVVAKWKMTCTRGRSAGGKSGPYTNSGQYTARTPYTRLLLQPISHDTSCRCLRLRNCAPFRLRLRNFLLPLVPWSARKS
jgi:hypothetical protein